MSFSVNEGSSIMRSQLYHHDWYVIGETNDFPINKPKYVVYTAIEYPNI